MLDSICSVSTVLMGSDFKSLFGWSHKTQRSRQALGSAHRSGRARGSELGGQKGTKEVGGEVSGKRVGRSEE